MTDPTNGGWHREPSHSAPDPDSQPAPPPPPPPAPRWEPEPPTAGWGTNRDRDFLEPPAAGQPPRWDLPAPQPETVHFSVAPPARLYQPSPQTSQQYGDPHEPSQQSAAQWAAPQSLFDSTPAQSPYGQQQWQAQGGGPGAAPPKTSNRRLFAILAAVLVAALVGGGLFFFLRGDDITYQGRDVVEPEKVLSEAESTLNRIVEERHGVASDSTLCYFVAKNADTTDIEDRVVCGPVLFVDGDAAKPYLTFPLQASSGDGDARLTVSTEPDSPEPAELDNPDLLRRPDGVTPPDGNGGLSVPEPPRAEAGIFTVVPTETIDLESTPATARVGSPTMSIELSGIGEPERYGRGDDARRPAENEKFVAFELASAPGERGPVADFSLTVQVDDADPVALPEGADLPGGPVRMAISVPDDTGDISLVVTEGTLVQRISLTTGEPDPGNIAVWQRTNRSQALTFSQAITLRASQPGFVTEDLAGTLTARQVDLNYFAGPNLDRTPSGPGQALLVVDAILDLAGQVGQLEPPFWSLTLPDGTVLPAGDLNDDPSLISIAFDVPASFTGGTLNFGGVLTTASGLTFDSLGVFLAIPIAIPEG